VQKDTALCGNLRAAPSGNYAAGAAAVFFTGTCTANQARSPQCGQAAPSDRTRVGIARTRAGTRGSGPGLSARQGPPC
jgi:hypothetical protein